MKTLLASVLVLSSISAFSITEELDGLTFCRTNKDDTLYCLIFENGVFTQRPNSMNKKISRSIRYEVRADKIFNLDADANSGFALFKNSIISEASGARFDIVH